MSKRHKDCDRQLALWRAFEQSYLALCRDGRFEYDAKVLRDLWLEFERDQRTLAQADALAFAKPRRVGQRSDHPQ